MVRLIALLTLVLMPSMVSAAPYAEFSPDYSQPLAVAVGTTVAQTFAPLNDRLAAIELWVSTGGPSAGLTVSLQDAAGTIVSERTVALGAIADVSGGTRFKITLPSQITVSGGELYRLNITPTGSPVTMYHGTSISAVPGSGTVDGASYRHGTAIVNGIEQGYSFKFALTETLETTIPIFSDLQITHPAIGQTHLSFHASEPVDVQISYGSRTVGWTGEYSPCMAGITVCTMLLSVTPGTEYSYTATLKDTWGNTSVVQGTFNTVGIGPISTSSGPPGNPSPTVSVASSPSVIPSAAPVKELVPPAIANPRLMSLTTTSAAVAWTTDEAADSSVVITGEGIYLYDETRELEHYMTVRGLLPDHYYRMRVSSTDAWGNYSDVLIIFTTPLTDNPPASATPVPTGSSAPTPTSSASSTPAPSYTVILPSTSLPPPGSPTPSGSATASPAASPTASGSISPTPTGTPSPTAVAYPSTSTQPGEIHWPPAGGNVDGYRIDIFDEFGNLITSITADANATSAPLPGGLPVGARIIIYADRGGAFEKVVDPISITDRPYVPGSSPLLTPVLVLVGGGTLLAALIVALVLQRRRQRVKVDAMTSIGIGGGQSSASSITRGLDS